jgi:predicted nucleic acid-binding Zn ribbon protein
MPLYEYSCDKCSQRIELLIRGDEKPEFRETCFQKAYFTSESLCARGSRS